MSKEFLIHRASGKGYTWRHYPEASVPLEDVSEGRLVLRWVREGVAWEVGGLWVLVLVAMSQRA